MNIKLLRNYQIENYTLKEELATFRSYKTKTFLLNRWQRYPIQRLPFNVTINFTLFALIIESIILSVYHNSGMYYRVRISDSEWCACTMFMFKSFTATSSIWPLPECIATAMAQQTAELSLASLSRPRVP